MRHIFVTALYETKQIITGQHILYLVDTVYTSTHTSHINKLCEYELKDAKNIVTLQSYEKLHTQQKRNLRATKQPLRSTDISIRALLMKYPTVMLSPELRLW